MELFLVLNGYLPQADDAACISSMEALAAGTLTEPDFSAWVSNHLSPAR